MSHESRNMRAVLQQFKKKYYRSNFFSKLQNGGVQDGAHINTFWTCKIKHLHII
jgi:hypothetical protein